MKSTEVMIDEMEPMFAEAKKRRLWFYSAYQNLWWSPDELRTEQEAGRFRWGPANFKLRAPAEYIAERQRAVDEETRRLEEAWRRIADWENGERTVTV